MLSTIPSQADEFEDRFWPSYPRHTAKKDARKAWVQLNPKPELVVEILDAIERQKAWRAQPGWKPDWPYPASWIRGERWTDEIPSQAVTTWKNSETLDSAPCPRCGSLDGLCRDIKTCNARWLQQQRAPAERA